MIIFWGVHKTGLTLFRSQNQRRPTTEGHDLFFGSKTEEDLQHKGTIYVSEPKLPMDTNIRHDTINRLLLVFQA